MATWVWVESLSDAFFGRMAISYSPECAKQLDNYCCVFGYLAYGEGTASLFWVARSFLICDDKTMAFAAQQDKSFDNSPLEEAVDLLHKWYHLRPRYLKSPCNPIGGSFATSAETVIRITGTKPESPCNLIGRSLLRVLR